MKPDTWRFHLRKNVKFHNGDDFTAKDVEFSFKLYHDSRNGMPSSSERTTPTQRNASTRDHRRNAWTMVRGTAGARVSATSVLATRGPYAPLLECHLTGGRPSGRERRTPRDSTSPRRLPFTGAVRVQTAEAGMVMSSPAATRRGPFGASGHARA